MSETDKHDTDEQLRNLIGLGNLSIRKSYYPELQSKIDELNKEKNRYERIFSDALNGIFQADKNGKILIANPSMVRLCGYSSLEEFLALGNIEEDLFVRKRDLNNLLKKIDSTNSIIGYETQFQIPGGGIIDVSLNASKVKRDNREILECFVQDITEQKKAQNYIVNIINSIHSILIGVDREGIITQWNRAAETTFRISPDNALGHPLEDTVPYLKEEMPHIRQSITGKEKKTGIRHIRLEDNTKIYEDIAIYPLTESGSEGAVIRIDDVTEQVKIQEMMIQSEKMLSVGGLAAGMAHEINNPLAGMMQTAGVMEKRLTGIHIPANIKAAEKAEISLKGLENYMRDRGIIRMIKAIGDSGKRASKIIENILNFARKGDTAKSTHDPVKLLDDILLLAESDFSLKKSYDFKNITIKKNYEKNIPLVLCVKSQIQQVILNILKNGSEAMAEMTGENTNPQFFLRLKKEKNMIRIEIEDNGPGMDNKTKMRIFEPFYTTKPVGIGTGLGLSVSYFIITENHKGTMEVESEPGKGARFIIRLPIRD